MYVIIKLSTLVFNVWFAITLNVGWLGLNESAAVQITKKNRATTQRLPRRFHSTYKIFRVSPNYETQTDADILYTRNDLVLRRYSNDGENRSERNPERPQSANFRTRQTPHPGMGFRQPYLRDIFDGFSVLLWRYVQIDDDRRILLLCLLIHVSRCTALYYCFFFFFNRSGPHGYVTRECKSPNGRPTGNLTSSLSRLASAKCFLRTRTAVRRTDDVTLDGSRQSGN